MAEQDKTAERIARQSQMERAIEYYQMCGICPSIEDLCLTSHILTKFIVNGWNGEYKELVQKLDKHISEQYKGK